MGIVCQVAVEFLQEVAKPASNVAAPFCIPISNALRVLVVLHPPGIWSQFSGHSNRFAGNLSPLTAVGIGGDQEGRMS